MGGGISGLHAKVVTAGDEVAVFIGENRANGKATFTVARAGFFEGGGEEFWDVHAV